MPEPDAQSPQIRLTLRSRLEDLALVVPWLDTLTAKYAIPGDTRFRIDLCLEEAISNIVRHGYGGQPDHAITIDFSIDVRTGLTFTVVDNAPHFAPNEQAEPVPAPQTLEDVTPGGLGIQLMEKFATTLRYEQLPDGNRLTLGFDLAPSKPADT